MQSGKSLGPPLYLPGSFKRCSLTNSSLLKGRKHTSDAPAERDIQIVNMCPCLARNMVLSKCLSDFTFFCSLSVYRLAGLVVKASASRAEDPGFESRLRRFFYFFFFQSGSSYTSDLTICTPVATLPGTWHYRVRAGTGPPGVNIL